jgi:methylated-DNA-[protein]-cysteine S-methyltransferase
MNVVEPEYDAVFNTDIATIGLLFEGAMLTSVVYLDEAIVKAPANKLVAEVKTQIEKYLATKSTIKSIKTELLLRVTPFQEKVLQQVQRIPYGETRTYGEIAKTLKTSARAVGNACRHNPIPIIISCHRVVAANGIGGYDGATSGKLLEIKRRLLALEGSYPE